MEDVRVCKKCGQVLDDDQDFCVKCGMALGKALCKNCGATLEEGQEYCHKCGSKVGFDKNIDKSDAISEYNNNVEKKTKKKHRILFVIGAVVLILLVGVFVWGLKQANWSVTQLKVIISGKHFSCLIEHSFEDATCEHGKICKECGLEIGEKAEHVWVEATCTKPKYCSVCNAIEGKAKGHSCRVGKCSVCGEYATELLPELTEINAYYSDAFNGYSKAVEYLKDASESIYLKSTYISYAQDSLNDAKQSLLKAAASCGVYSEFSEIKTKLTNAANTINTTSSNTYTLANSASESLGYLEGISEQIQEWSK